MRSEYECLIPTEARGRAVCGPPGLRERRREVFELRRWMPNKPLFSYQRSLVGGLLDICEQELVYGVVAMPTGAGKTRTIVQFVLDVLATPSTQPRLVVWVAPQRELLHQACETFLSTWSAGMGPDVVDIRILKTSRGPFEIFRDSIVLLTPSMLNRVHDRVAPISGIVFDEAHHAPAPKTLHSLTSLQSRSKGVWKFFLGTTATPFRASMWEMRSMLEIFGDNLYYSSELGVQPFPELLKSGVLAKPVFQKIYGVADYNRRRAISDPRSARSLVLESDRWSAVIDTICKVVQRPCVVFALDRSHGKALCRHLRFSGVSAEYIDGETSPSVRAGVFERFLNRSTEVLVNVGLLTEGVDCPSAESVVLTYPVESVVFLRQMIGRVLRGPQVGGTESGFIYSIDGDQKAIDEDTFKVNYSELGWTLCPL